MADNSQFNLFDSFIDEFNPSDLLRYWAGDLDFDLVAQNLLYNPEGFSETSGLAGGLEFNARNSSHNLEGFSETSFNDFSAAGDKTDDRNLATQEQASLPGAFEAFSKPTHCSNPVFIQTLQIRQFWHLTTHRPPHSPAQRPSA